MIKNYALEIKWGVFFILMQLAWMTMERLAGLHDTHIDKHAVVTNLVAIPAILMYVLALREKRNKQLGGAMTYRQGFTAGLIMTIVVTLLSPLSQYITSTIITPDYFENAIQYAVSSGASTQEEAEANFNLKNYLMITVLFTPVMGIVTTAIVALFLKKGPKTAN